MDNVIKILIEGDATGLTSSLKSALDSVKQNVSKMNDQQVDWDSILAKTISPTIIGAVAATFASAIAQYINFQNAAVNLNNIATPATAAFANSINTAGGSAYQMAQTANQSLGDTAAAYNAFTKAGLDGAAATTALNDASEISYATGESFASVVSELVTLFQQWGVTTTPQVTDALQGLTNAAQNGSFTFDQLVSSISAQGPLLSTKTSINAIATSLATLSTTSGASQSTILQAFSAIAGATGTTAIQMNAEFGGAASAISTGPNGLITAFQDIQKSISTEAPLVAQTFGQSVGLMNTTISGFSQTSAQKLQAVQTAFDQLYTHEKSVADITSQTTPQITALGKAWTDFQTSIAEFILPEGVSVLAKLLTGITGAVTEINDLAGGGGSTVSAATGAGSKTFWATLAASLYDNLNAVTLGGLGAITGVQNIPLPELPTNTNAPVTNAPTKSTTATTINTTVNMNGAGSGTNPLITGQSLGTKIYNATLGQL
jgi:hypothetical protein